MTDDLNFHLRPSMAKWILRILVLCGLGILLASALPLLWTVLIILGVVFFSYILRDKYPVKGFAHLDQELWTIDDHQQFRQMKMQHAINYEYFVFIKFSDDLTKKTQYICIAKDQLDFNQWKALKKRIKLH